MLKGGTLTLAILLWTLDWVIRLVHSLPIKNNLPINGFGG